MNDQQPVKCIFYNAKCTSRERDNRVEEIYALDVKQFITLICGVCIKNRYARTKERLSKTRYTVVNTL